ncbi:MAG: PIN domain-containing protein [Myxococcales bacterium]|nr:PIN domain-containing protein [Myxococcales bacterium]
MRFYADASFLVALYRETRFSEEAKRLVARHSPLVLLSPLSRLEVVRSLARDRDPRRLARFREDLATGSKIRVADVASWPEGLRLAETWVQRTSRRLSTGATDTLVVALASLAGATHFLSFDQGSHQRVVALMAGLSVLPAHSREEKALALPV